MLRDHFLVLDEYLPSTSDIIRSSDVLATRLARHDQVALYVVAEDSGGAPGDLTIYIEHSADGHTFVKKNNISEIDGVPLTANKTTCMAGCDAGVTASLAAARIVASSSGAAAARVRVRVWASTRDTELAPAEAPPPPPKRPTANAQAQAAAKQVEISTKNDQRGGPPLQQPPQSSD
jgi:hypothetical protein